MNVVNKVHSYRNTVLDLLNMKDYVSFLDIMNSDKRVWKET